jgi:hypothetical protein
MGSWGKFPNAIILRGGGTIENMNTKRKTYGSGELPDHNSEQLADLGAIEQGGAAKRLPDVLDMTRTLIAQGWPAVSAFAEASARVRFVEKFNAAR